MNKALAIILLMLLPALPSGGQHIVKEKGEPVRDKFSWVVVPYVFSTEMLGFGAGIGGTYGPASQPYATLYGTGYITENGSYLGLLGGNNLLIPGSERLFIRPLISAGRYTQLRVYVDGNPDYSGEQAGSNDSSAGNYIEKDAWDLQMDLQFRYVLPIGHFRDSAVQTYNTEAGLLVSDPSGAESWNPLESGRSTVVLRPYYRKQFTELDEADALLQTFFFEAALEHDNRDFSVNPGEGYFTRLSVSHDPDLLTNTRRWTALEGELDGYIPLWDTDWSRQQVLALSIWASYAPAMKPGDPDKTGKPPYFVGPTLGGFHHLRGYPSNRFHDKAAIHYAAEYRLMPDWQPFGSIGLLDPLKIRWWQVVGLVEVGRVADSWNSDLLYRDMKYDVGFGLRMMFGSSVGRLDIVTSEEATKFLVMFGQSF